MAQEARAIQQRVAEHDVRFIRLQFTDILGIVKNVAIPVSELERALAGQILFDGSSIEGFTRIEESDMLLQPDLDTFALFPWRPRQNAVARLICDVHLPDGQPFTGDPRYILRQALAAAAAAGFAVEVGPECEFFLFHRSPEGKPTTLTHDEGSYFDMGPVDLGEDARREIVLALADMGVQVEASHHEVAPGQHEVDLKHAPALTAADRIATFKFVARSVAAQHNLHVTFMPKPVFGVNGSGMHIHVSLRRDGRNAFYEPSDPEQFSSVGRWFVAGLLTHAAAITAITNPVVNSYKRLIPGYEAPVYISWSTQNRSTLIRIPAARGENTRLEYRAPDPSCNPYLALAVIIQAGLDGVRRQLDPPPPVQANVYQLSEADRVRAGVRSLPSSLAEALDALARDEVVRSALGEHVFSHFLAAKRLEWDVYRSQVHAWELDQYLGAF